MLQVGAHLNAGMPDNPLIAIAVASLTDMIKCLLEAGVDANIITGGSRKKKLKDMNPEKEAKGYEFLYVAIKKKHHCFSVSHLAIYLNNVSF
jgi:hypothetical protein